MKFNLILFAGFLLLATTCRLPSDPIGEIKIIKRLDTINTGGNCLDLDVNDSTLVAAANFNGFFVYQLYDSSNKLNPKEVFHGYDLDPNIADNQIEKVILSKSQDIMVLLDQYDKIYVNRLDGSPVFFLGDESWDCLGGAWTDVVIDDQDTKIKILTLINHGVQPPEEEAGLDLYSKSIGWQSIENYTPFSPDNLSFNKCEFSLNLHDETDKMYFDDGLLAIGIGEQGVKVYNQLENSTCFKKIESESLVNDFHINISSDLTISGYSWIGKSISANLNANTAKILVVLELQEQPTGISNLEFFDPENNLINFVFDEQNGEGDGNRVWLEKIDEQIYMIKYYSDTEIARFQFNISGTEVLSDLNKLFFPIIDFNYTGDYEADKSSCEYGILLGGYGGIYEPAGGLSPNEFSSFDTPGSVNNIFMQNSTVFAGLSASNGCKMAVLGSAGNLLNITQFASGYSIRGIHNHNGLLALAAGHDGVLLYDWNSTEISFKGRIDMPYANAVKVLNNIIYVATEDGIEIIEIDNLQ